MDADDINNLKINSNLLRRQLSINLPEDFPVLESSKDTVTYNYFLKKLNNDVPWLDIDTESLQIAEGLDRISTVTHAMLRDGLYDTRLLDIYKSLYKSMYTHVWYNSHLSDVADTYVYLDMLRQATKNIKAVKTKSVPKQLQENRVVAIIEQISVRSFRSKYLFIRFICWLILISLVAGIMTNYLIVKYSIEIDSKVIIGLVSIPIATATLFSLNYKQQEK